MVNNVCGQNEDSYLSLYMLLFDGIEASAHAAGWEEEPVHENPFAVIVRIIGQKAMPFVLLLAATLAVALLGLNSPVKFN